MTMKAIGSTATTTDDTQCQICHSRPARPDGAICWVCMGSEQSDPAPVMYPVDEEKPAQIICPRCNKPHDGFQQGKQLINICQECIVAQRKQTWIKNRPNHKRMVAMEQAVAEPAKPKAKAKPVASAPRPPITLLIDFTEHPELLDLLKKMAFLNFRTPEAQILYLLSL